MLRCLAHLRPTTRRATRGCLTHVTPDNMPTMKSVTDKKVTKRTARAISSVFLPEEVASRVKTLGDQGAEIESSKGPVFATGIIAGTMAVKKTSDLIPFCHPLPIEACSVNVMYESGENGTARARIECTVEVTSKTGVEMEALTGASMCALTIYDMLKALSQKMVIEETRLVRKTGGKSDINVDH
ncbi:hypothetical protein AAMO2058_000468100 [Amorphochlora amoebiformis]